ncbi:hypothetical protein VNI00_009410 [Paramarasmius palmivorus]|uniref:Protein kinase domain-containing protein n=1 Tax=Paramarasmius palmivorus TaxID=297713 RepID=A0AAW0CM32_9AGAR
MLSHALRRFESFQLEDFLVVKLQQIAKAGVKKEGQLLDEALEAMVSYANGEVLGAVELIEETKQKLKECCEEPSETTRYQAFVLAANSILKAIQGCATESFPEVNNHVTFATDNHSGDHPMVINVYTPDIAKEQGTNDNPSYSAPGSAEIKNSQTSKWPHPLSCWVFRAANAALPDSAKRLYQPYTAKGPTTIPPQSIASMVDEPTMDDDGFSQFERDLDWASNDLDESESTVSTALVIPLEAVLGLRTRMNMRLKCDSSAAIQVAEYAADALGTQFSRAFMINYVVHGTVIHIWIFDNDTPLQSYGFDFIEDLPTFFVLLFILQRLPSVGWGIIPELYQDSIELESPDSSIVTFIPNDKDELLYSHSRLGGRSTQVLEGEVDGRRAVLKHSRVEIWRHSEATLITIARKRCEYFGNKLQDTLRCLPVVLGSRDFPELSTDRIRMQLKVEPKSATTRIPRLVAFPWYEPITSLTKDMDLFMDAFCELMLAHATLWLLGVEHGDINEQNLRFSVDDGHPKLCDFDLSGFSGESSPSNIGTPIFMAKDLLAIGGFKENIQKTYRHDAESFAHVLVWILGRYRNGLLRESPPFEDWKDSYPLLIATRRNQTLNALFKKHSFHASVFDGVDDAHATEARSLWANLVIASSDYEATTQLVDHLSISIELRMREMATLRKRMPWKAHITNTIENPVATCGTPDSEDERTEKERRDELDMAHSRLEERIERYREALDVAKQKQAKLDSIDFIKDVFTSPVFFCLQWVANHRVGDSRFVEAVRQIPAPMT